MISVISFLVIGLTLLGLFIYAVNMLIRQVNIFGFLLFMFVYLSVYMTIQILLFDFFGNSFILTINKLVKESIIIFVLLLWVVSRKNLFSFIPQWKVPDYLMFIFLIVPALFMIFPIGPATFINKAVYFKGILMLGFMYFLGRVMILDHRQIKTLFHTLLLVAICGFFVTLVEKLTNTHFQSLIPYEAYQIQVDDSEPTGNYGLTWTFEAASGRKRYAAFFSNPLEMASFMILCGAVALYLWFNEVNRFRKSFYSMIFIFTVLILFISFSRSSFAGFILMLFLAAFLMGYWRIILGTLIIGISFFVILFTFGQEELRYFIIDTLTFSESSSASHVIEWVSGINSMIENPFGIGLATSGGAGGVDPDLQIGGENQFIIFGVQMGVLYMMLYIALLVSSIYTSFRAFRKCRSGTTASIPFVAGAFKFAFLIPLMTSNAEIFLLVAYLSWWMVGQSVSINSSTKALCAES